MHAQPARPHGRGGILRTLGLYASAGAKFGPGFLWTAPVTFPMMVAVVYLSGKLGQVAGEGLFAVLKRHYSRWLFVPTLVGVLIGNTIEAAADIGVMAAALRLIVPCTSTATSSRSSWR